MDFSSQTIASTQCGVQGDLTPGVGDHCCVDAEWALM